MSLIPIEYTYWDFHEEYEDICGSVIEYKDVIFLEDYGVFKKDDKFTVVMVNFSKGKITGINEKGTITQYFKIFLTSSETPSKIDNCPCLNNKHDFPDVWFSTFPPSYRKCGSSAIPIQNIPINLK